MKQKNYKHFFTADSKDNRESEYFILNEEHINVLKHFFEIPNKVIYSALLILTDGDLHWNHPYVPYVKIVFDDGEKFIINLSLEHAIYLIFCIHVWDIKLYVIFNCKYSEYVPVVDFVYSCQLDKKNALFLSVYENNPDYKIVDVSERYTRFEIKNILNKHVKSRFFREILYKNYLLDYLTDYNIK